MVNKLQSISVKVVNSEMEVLSAYARDLPLDAKARYLQKIFLISGLDPFKADGLGNLVDDIPPIEACDLVSYLVLQTSFVTARQFKARKGQFVSG